MLLCGEIHSKPHSNEDDGPVFSVAEVPLNGIDPLVRYCTLSFSERNVPFPGKLSCFTCTCFTALHVHVKQLCISAVDIFFPDLANECHRVIVSRSLLSFAFSLLLSPFSLLLSLLSHFIVTIVSLSYMICF